MADWETQEPGLEGQQCNTVSATMISRCVEDAGGIGFGQPVKQGSNAEQCLEGITTTDFVGITVRQADKGQFNENDMARIMTEGVIWVKVGAGKTAVLGTKPTWDGGWSTGGTTVPQLVDARYETGGSGGELVKIRMWGAGVAST